jgi:ABC-type polysaccharide/polyol phosphate transport system ATPase subunit
MADAITLSGVSKHFRIPHDKRNTVYSRLAATVLGKSQTYEEFYALKGVSFSIRKGEAFGILGKNGSGKSTLLKIIAGIMRPDAGAVKTAGRITPFIELGVGFNQELSGRENVFLYGSIMGLKKPELEARFNDIVAFAELGRFMDTKLKNYSSGMYARLAFATAIHVNPDILLVDEVLAVGDKEFKDKCYEKMSEFKKQGKTIVLVSHDLETVRSFCSRAAFIHKGKLVSVGPAEKAAQEYTEFILREEADAAASPKGAQGSETRWGSREIEITGVEFLNDKTEKTRLLETGKNATVRIAFSARERIESPSFGVGIKSPEGSYLFGISTKVAGFELPPIGPGKGTIDFVLDPVLLVSGRYTLSGAAYFYDKLGNRRVSDHNEQLSAFVVESGTNPQRTGFVAMPFKWKFQP